MDDHDREGEGERSRHMYVTFSHVKNYQLRWHKKKLMCKLVHVWGKVLICKRRYECLV